MGCDCLLLVFCIKLPCDNLHEWISEIWLWLILTPRQILSCVNGTKAKNAGNQWQTLTDTYSGLTGSVFTNHVIVTHKGSFCWLSKPTKLSFTVKTVKKTPHLKTWNKILLLLKNDQTDKCLVKNNEIYYSSSPGMDLLGSWQMPQGYCNICNWNI